MSNESNRRSIDNLRMINPPMTGHEFNNRNVGLRNRDPMGYDELVLEIVETKDDLDDLRISTGEFRGD